MNHEEYIQRMMFAVQVSTDPYINQHQPERAREAREIAAIMAEESIAGGMLGTIEGVRIAAQAILRDLVAKGEIQEFDCGMFLPCACNSLLKARAERGVIAPLLAKESSYKVPWCENSECPKSSVPRVFRDDDHHLATSSRWTGDTASVKVG